MSEQHPEDLLAAYALDALPDEERRTVRDHIASCPRCRRSLQEFQQVTGVLPLADSHVPAPPALRDRIVAAAQATAQLPADRPARRWRLLAERQSGWLAAAALFLATLGLGGWDLAQHRMLAIAQQQPALLHAPLAATADAPGATGSLVTISGRAAILSVDHLAPRPRLIYEAWVITGGVPRPAGTFATTPDGHGSISLAQPVQPGDTVAVTAEAPPGAPTPTGKILLAGKAPPSPAG